MKYLEHNLFSQMSPILTNNAFSWLWQFFFFSKNEEFLIGGNFENARLGNSLLHDLMYTPSPPTLTLKKSCLWKILKWQWIFIKFKHLMLFFFKLHKFLSPSYVPSHDKIPPFSSQIRLLSWISDTSQECF